MPNTKSAKKRHRQDVVRRLRNRSVKSNLKTIIRQVHEAVSAGNVAQGETILRTASKKHDQAAAAGVIHVNRAARVKSRLSAALKAAKTQGSPAAKTKGSPAAKKTSARKKSS